MTSSSACFAVAGLYVLLMLVLLLTEGECECSSLLGEVTTTVGTYDNNNDDDDDFVDGG